MSEKLFMKYTHYQVVEEEESEKMSVSIWKDGDKIRLDNEFMTAWKDEQVQVILMKESQLIILMNVNSEKGAGTLEAWQNTSLAGSLDSLKKMTTDITCERNGKTATIVFEFPLKDNRSELAYKRILLEYAPASGQLYKGEYEYHAPDGLKKEVYLYEGMSHTFDDDILSGSALSKLMVNGVIRPAYKDFEIRDLRRQGNPAVK